MRSSGLKAIGVIFGDIAILAKAYIIGRCSAFPAPPTAGERFLFLTLGLKKEKHSAGIFYKLSISILLFLFFALKLQSQTPGWQWATGPVGQTVVAGVCADASGHEYVTGHFLGSIYFNSDTLKDNVDPYQDIFIAAYNAQGQPLWAKSASGYADAAGISADAFGHIYITGTFYNDSIFFGSQVLVNANAGPQNSNIFLARYDTTGNLEWVKNPGGVNNDVATAVSTDIAGNVYITGNFAGDSLSFGNITLQHLGTNDGFIAKFNQAGDALWARNIGSAFLNGCTAVATDGYGNVLVTGYFFNNSIYLDSTGNTLTSPYASNVFVVKYDSSGNIRWAKYAGSNNGNGPGGITADAQGNVYITGYFSDTIALDNTTITGNGIQNIFTAKYDPAGTLLWAQATGGSNIDQPAGIACDGLGKAYITGYFQSDTISFGVNQLYNPAGAQVTFLAQYDTLGFATFAIAPGGESNSTGAGLCLSAGSVYLTGNFQNDDIIFGNDTLQAAAQNIFLAKTDTINIATGIKQVNNDSKNIIIFPNPSSGVFYISGVSQTDKIEVFNLLGQRVFSGTATGSIYLFSLGDRAKGVYLYRVYNDDGIVQQGKIAVE